MPPDRKTESTPAVAPIGKIDLDVRRMNGQQLRSEIMKDRKEMKQLREELAKPGKHREEQLEDLRTRLADYSKRANTDTLLGWHFFLGDRTEEGIVLADLLRKHSAQQSSALEDLWTKEGVNSGSAKLYYVTSMRFTDGEVFSMKNMVEDSHIIVRSVPQMLDVFEDTLCWNLRLQRHGTWLEALDEMEEAA